MDGLRIFTASAVANVLGLLFPIRNDIFGLVLLFTVNFVVGLLADVWCESSDKFMIRA